MVPAGTARYPFVIIAALWLMTSYESRHADRIYTGVTALGIDLGGLTPAEARSALDTAVIAANPQDIVLVDPSTGTEWHKTATDLGIHYDLDTIVDTAFNIGRSGSQVQQLREQAVSWYYGTPVPVAVIVDESYVDRVVEELAASIDRAPVDGSLQMVDGEVSSVATQFGKTGQSRRPYPLDATRHQPAARSRRTADSRRATPHR